MRFRKNKRRISCKFLIKTSISMKFHYILPSLLFAASPAVSQQLPDFSNGDVAQWRYIQFDVNGSVIQDMGAGKDLLNKSGQENLAAQQWKLTGRQDSCVLVSALGNYLHYRGKDNNRFESSATLYTPMRLVASSSGKWELELRDKSLAAASDKATLVINGGSGLDHYLDLWKHDFNACALNFPSSDQMEFPQLPPADVPEKAITYDRTAPQDSLTLWYTAPAKNWTTEALPIGNGEMGAMIFGGIAQDRIQFNHKTLWKGSKGTTDLGSYLTFGDLYVINKNAKVSTSYQRRLSLSEAVAQVKYTSGDADYNREYLASNPDNVIAIHYTASDGNPIHVVLQLINGQGGKRASYTDHGATFAGAVANKMNFRATLAIEQKGGTVSADRDGIEVEGASELTLYLTCGTDFDPLKADHLTGDADELRQRLDGYVAAATAKGFDAVRRDHVADYRQLFDRVTFSLPAAANKVSTDKLLQQTGNAGSKAMTDLLVFQYGRYLAIASSRGVSLPSNLQGIWCKDGTPSSQATWASDIHSNINVQMNYWPVESTNLSELHMPFLEYIHNEATRSGGTWQQNAKDLGVSKGWVVNTAGNIFGGSSNYKRGHYSVANAWYCQHLWQHFAYTRDTTYLRELALPVMKSACEFWFGRLVPAQNGDGTLECPDEYSPEQGRIQNATAHGQQLVYELFTNMAEAIRVLGDASGCDQAFQSTLAEKTQKLDRGLRVDSKGLLREWKYQENTPNIPADTNPFANDEQNVWQCHRHPSHLMALYPGFEIDLGGDRTIYNAALASLKDRGDVSTGWGRAFRLALWARTRNAEKAYQTLRGFAHRTTATSYDWHGGLYDNLLDAHATSVFQIEGNFGATAGIAEMLLQSRPDSIVLLPSLPTAWADGSIKGLKTMGNFEIDMQWKDGRANSVRIVSEAGMPIMLAYPGIERATIATADGQKVQAATNVPNRLAFPTVKGTVYVIQVPAEVTGITHAVKKSALTVNVSGQRIHVKGAKGPVKIYDMDGRLQFVGDRLRLGAYIVQAGSETAVVLVH